jgi:predicted membrane chloride channel (bestrophin family)
MSTKNREKAWAEFVSWCRVRGLRPLPAHPWTIAAYARWCEPRHKFTNIVARVRAIARAHLLECVAAPDRHPTVARTLRTIELRQRTKSQRAALFAEDVAAATKGPAKAKAKATGLRRSRALRQAPRLVSRRPRPD